MIPNSRTTNVVTKTSWEHIGVKPDVAVLAAQALQTAHATILRQRIASAKGSDAQETAAPPGNGGERRNREAHLYAHGRA
jgi:hypothetical protein